jgi:hypothetical protein
MAFTVLLGFLVALPSFGIDMSLPALTAMGAALGVPPSASSFCLEHKCTIAPRCMLASSGGALAFAQPIFHVCAFA